MVAYSVSVRGGGGGGGGGGGDELVGAARIKPKVGSSAAISADRLGSPEAATVKAKFGVFSASAKALK